MLEVRQSERVDTSIRVQEYVEKFRHREIPESVAQISLPNVCVSPIVLGLQSEAVLTVEGISVVASFPDTSCWAASSGQLTIPPRNRAFHSRSWDYVEL